MAWFIFTYGMLIYKQLGASAQNEFAKVRLLTVRRFSFLIRSCVRSREQTWGVGYGLNSASEWQDVAITACKAALLIAILDLLRLSKNSTWFEVGHFCVAILWHTWC